MNLLSIGGSDPSSGAGIQSDIKVFSTLKAHGLTVITAITGQNTSSFGMVEPVSDEILKNQLDKVFFDFKVDGIKIGMVYNSRIMKVIHNRLKKLKIPIVVDPVIRSTTGGDLIEKSAIKDFKKLIVPLATVISPNKFEAEILSNSKIDLKNPPNKIAQKIQKMGAKNVVITGIETKNNKISDFVLEKNTKYAIYSNKIDSINHGSGCNYSAAIIYSLAKKKNIKESVKFAKEFTFNSIKNAKNLGRGIVITDVLEDKYISQLSESINKFVAMKNIYKNIPECQTNFVFAKKKPKSTKDILGISGRIIKAGKKVIVAGNLEYGGSKHVATALLVINKKFPEINSAINLKFQTSTISKIKKSKFVMTSYNRLDEPKNVKNKGSTIQWGIKHAIKNSKKTPDIIYHKGDFGKEPMILVFGKTPDDVLQKILKIV
ncbi:MAG: bifunctional hydroxymethylpyrimidine kinase/phosphomethylpyrimidine kinase [Nitrosopumilus sp.]|uniref:bifunctional hydroxymethylpyrimidine kinase/phosphomethylpyrimidine kinase n=1 Tax=Nitrosopumilus sp. TaxID=2024843 RepID=UPI00247BE172|nr:bifunctional hydroxymethylpyrimidine kinase/phosphomethylpyrimidine kinase [Nitrosopumilus sp.]MCV0391807.1 bifunctional hydroxymethylpyrimidine kinase/phosphomethylpyrimidine kinase [Nitrosopumilus sp.]